MTFPDALPSLEPFARLREDLDQHTRARVEWAADAGEAMALQAAQHWDFNAPAAAADSALRRGEAAEGDPHALDELRRALVARWALDLPARLARLNLPPEVLALYPQALAILAQTLTAPGPYDPDHWAKDVRLVLGLTVPCGAQLVDLHARIGPGEVLRHAVQRSDPLTPLRYLAATGRGPWAQIHTEQRHLDDFNPAGWDACYVRIARLLERRPELRGMMGSSWFYDPPLRGISPRLAYLQERPLQNGAFLVHQGTGPLYTERATQTSPTRRKLVEAGEYTPRSWILAWPRAAMIRWAQSQEKTQG
jgi:hypothetical protein